MSSFAEYAMLQPNAWSEVESKILEYVVNRHGKRMMKPERVARTTVLDLAAGTGRVSRYFISRGISASNITAVDVNYDLLKDQTFPLGVKQIHGDVRNLDHLLEAGQTFNFVVANMLLHLLSTEDVLEVFRQVRKHLAAQDSYFLAVVPHPLRASLTTTQSYEREGQVVHEMAPWGQEVVLHHRTVLGYQRLLFEAGLEQYNMATAWKGSESPANYTLLTDNKIWPSVVNLGSEARERQNMRLWFLSFWDSRKNCDESRMLFGRQQNDFQWP